MCLSPVVFASTRIKCSLVAAPSSTRKSSASSPSSHSVESINRKRPSDLSGPASYHLRVSKHTNLNWKGQGKLPWMQHALHPLAFPPLSSTSSSSSSFPSRRWNKRSNKTTAPPLHLQGFSPPWLWTNRYYSITISSMNRFQPISLYSMANILLYSVLLFERTVSCLVAFINPLRSF